MKHRALLLLTVFLVLSLNSYCVYRYVKVVVVPTKEVVVIPEEKLQTGDIILRRGKGMVSHLFAQMSQNDPYYSHAGIVLRQAGTLRVVSSTQDCAKPGVIGQELHDFLQPEITEDYAVYRYPVSLREMVSLQEKLQNDIIHPLPFDSSFELGSDSAYYCTEYIYQRMKSYANCSQMHVSSSGDWKYIAPEDLYLNMQGKFIINGRNSN
jgi:hypothetical protein